MAQEGHLVDPRYISSQRAAEITGYSRDYIGQLARAGKIMASRIGGIWYVLEESLHSHKKRADEYTLASRTATERSAESPAMDSIVSFDGSRYVSLSEGAKITGYNQDYIGQLARAGTILARQVANRWFVDANALKAHKDEKDHLLAAVQTEAVGLRRDTKNEDEREVPYSMHFSYTSDEGDLIPVLEAVEPSIALNITDEVEEHVIPIRIVHTAVRPARTQEPSLTSATRSPFPLRKYAYGGLTAAMMTIVIVLAFNVSLFDAKITFTDARKQSNVVNAALVGTVDTALQGVKQQLDALFIHKIEYQRK